MRELLTRGTMADIVRAIASISATPETITSTARHPGLKRWRTGKSWPYASRGKRECVRVARQIASGSITVSNGLFWAW